MTKTIVPILLFVFVTQSCSQKNKESDAGLKDLKNSTEVFTLENPPEIGTWQGSKFYEGGFSGLYYIPGTNYEFYIVNDRGPNLEVQDSLDPNKHIKLFPFPDYSQKLVRVRAEKNKLIVLQIDTLKSPFKNLSGLTLPTLLQNDQAEIAWKNMQGDIIPNDEWGLDAEALAFENDSIFWIADEYRPSLWKFNKKNSTVISIFSPTIGYNTEFKLPNVFLYRDANKGFESIAITPKGKVASMLQSPITNFSKDIKLSSRLSRFLLFDSKTGISEVYAYEMNDQVTGKEVDWKIGDMVSISDTQFLVLEHGKIDGELSASVYLIDISAATNIQQVPDSKIEEYNTAEDLKRAKDISCVSKTLLLDLTKNGYDKSIGKPEGLAIINDSTIAVLNDNDFAIEELSNGSKKPKTQTMIYFFNLRQKLNSKL